MNMGCLGNAQPFVIEQRAYSVELGSGLDRHAGKIFQQNDVLPIWISCDLEGWATGQELYCWPRQLLEATCVLEILKILRGSRPEHKHWPVAATAYVALLTMMTSFRVHSGCCCCCCCFCSSCTTFSRRLLRASKAFCLFCSSCNSAELTAS